MEMINLILKDLIIQRKTLVFMGFYIILFTFAFQSVGAGAFAGIVIAVTYQLVVTASSLEDKAGSDIIMNSLPINRRELVMAKYLSVIMYGIMGVIGYMAFSLIIRLTSIPVNTPPITLESLAAAFAGIMVMNGIYYPVYFKFGFVKARIISFILFFAFFFGIMSLFEAASSHTSNESLLLLINLFSGANKVQSSILLIAGAFIFMLASCMLSMKIYKGREF